MTLLLSLQCLYVSLPALLECNPFQNECRESWRASPPLPEELRRVVLIYQAVLDLLRQYEVHPEITSQMFAYLFFFSNTLLFNQLLDKGQSSSNTQSGLGNPWGTSPWGDPPVHPSATSGSTGGRGLEGAGGGQVSALLWGGQAQTQLQPPGSPSPGGVEPHQCPILTPCAEPF